MAALEKGGMKIPVFQKEGCESLSFISAQRHGWIIGQQEWDFATLGRVHPDRVARRHRDHRDAGGAPSSLALAGQGESSIRSLPEQRETVGPGRLDVFR